jgi:hypothetical protein
MSFFFVESGFSRVARSVHGIMTTGPTSIASKELRFLGSRASRDMRIGLRRTRAGGIADTDHKIAKSPQPGKIKGLWPSFCPAGAGAYRFIPADMER